MAVNTPADLQDRRASKQSPITATVLSDAQAAACLRLAREILSNRKGLLDAVDIPTMRFDMINLTVYSSGRLRASVTGRGSTLVDAIEDACRRALRDARFGPTIRPDDVAKGRLELWVQHTAAPVTDPRDIDLGIDGVSLKLGTNKAYYKPSVALTQAIVRPEELLDKLARKARLTAAAWRVEGAEILRTQWEHYAERPGGYWPLRLRRMRPVDIPPITKAAVSEAAMLAAQRLLIVQQPAGFYLYEEHPFGSRPAVGPVNLVRQAGCAYAVARAAEAFVGADACTDSARRAATLLLQSSVTVPGGGLFLVEPGTRQGRLGVTALTLAALQCRSLAGSFREERKKLCAGIISMQREDGSFRCVNRDNSAEADGRKQDFYPGEALMALCRDLQDEPDLLRRAIEAAFPWYRDYFRRNQTTAFVPWQADAWRIFTEWLSEQGQRGVGDPYQYASFVFEIVDWLLRYQNDEATCPRDFAGGFAVAGAEPGVSTASYAEAVIRAFGLAKRLGDAVRIDRYRRSARLAVGFLFRLRVPRETAFLFKHPLRVVGGTTKSLRDMTIRCDFDQHMITALLAALETQDLLEDNC